MHPAMDVTTTPIEVQTPSSQSLISEDSPLMCIPSSEVTAQSSMKDNVERLEVDNAGGKTF